MLSFFYLRIATTLSCSTAFLLEMFDYLLDCVPKTREFGLSRSILWFFLFKFFIKL